LILMFDYNYNTAFSIIMHLKFTIIIVSPLFSFFSRYEVPEKIFNKDKFKILATFAIFDLYGLVLKKLTFSKI
nr:hypothetical protein [Thermoflexibacter sp.]